jgi:hypothetical protein
MDLSITVWGDFLVRRRERFTKGIREKSRDHLFLSHCFTSSYTTGAEREIYAFSDSLSCAAWSPVKRRFSQGKRS